ncbi:MAG: hypothetical protein BWY85_01045 [Firmicutes bacterium ADurb.Bin506]|nr:MAG: hypothetical protein BWY85_01045 [Firmicutes bacterium ADurb.Bin506]
MTATGPPRADALRMADIRSNALMFMLTTGVCRCGLMKLALPLPLRNTSAASSFSSLVAIFTASSNSASYTFNDTFPTRSEGSFMFLNRSAMALYPITATLISIWSASGHSGVGHIAVFCTSLANSFGRLFLHMPLRASAVSGMFKTA